MDGRTRYMRACPDCYGAGFLANFVGMMCRCYICDGSGYVRKCRECGTEIPSQRRVCEDCETAKESA